MEKSERKFLELKTEKSGKDRVANPEATEKPKKLRVFCSSRGVYEWADP